MTAHEAYLLRRAVEVFSRTLVGWFTIHKHLGGRYEIEYAASRPTKWTGLHPTLADALAVLLRDLGEEVPEPPSMAQVKALLAKWEVAIDEETFNLVVAGEDFRHEPLTVLALLEGEGS